MTVTLSFTCPHCQKGARVALGDVEAVPAVRVLVPPAAPPPAPVAPAAKGAMCGCGHERTWHEGEAHTGACTYGHCNVHGGCDCTLYHSRRQGLAAARKAERSEDGAPTAADVAARKCEGAILSCLLTELRPVSRVRVGLRTLYQHDAGGFGNALSALRSVDLIDDVNGGVMLSDAGKRVAIFRNVPKGHDVVRAWQGKVGKCEREILDVLLAALPHALRSRSEIAERTVSRYAADAGGFGNALSHLRSIGLLVDCALNQEIF